MFITPIAGAVGGGTAAKSASSFSTIGGIVTGVLVGVGLLAGFRWLIRKVPDGMNVMQKRHEWLAVLTMIFVIPFGFPVLTYVLSRFIVGSLLQL